MSSPVMRAKRFYNLATGEMFYASEAGSMPIPSDMPLITGLFVGGCVMTGVGSPLELKDPSNFDAHVHIGYEDYRGWICVRSPQVMAGENWDTVRWHEYAHVLSNSGHDERWRRAMRKLGQPIPDRYAHRARNK